MEFRPSGGVAGSSTWRWGSSGWAQAPLGLRQSRSVDNEYRRRVRWVFHAVVVTLAVAALASSATHALGEASTPTSGGPWYRVALEQGEWQGYHWAVGAAGPRHEPLGEICALISVIEPFQEGSPYVEASDAKVCGSLPDATVSNVLGETLGSGASKQTLVAALYRPIVHKVTFILGTGERKVYRSRMPRMVSLPFGIWSPPLMPRPALAA
jgi:hypothetical protein